MSVERSTQSDSPDDGTRALLRAGAGMLLAGLLAVLLTATVFGGIGRQGPHTNAGWLSFMVAMACLPFGLMLFILGAAKWFRSRRLARQSGSPTR